jgi:hypothetical protein
VHVGHARSNLPVRRGLGPYERAGVGVVRLRCDRELVDVPGSVDVAAADLLEGAGQAGEAGGGLAQRDDRAPVRRPDPELDLVGREGDEAEVAGP